MFVIARRWPTQGLQSTNAHQLSREPRALDVEESRGLPIIAPVGQYGDDAIRPRPDAQFLGFQRAHEPPLNLLTGKQKLAVVQ